MQWQAMPFQLGGMPTVQPLLCFPASSRMANSPRLVCSITGNLRLSSVLSALALQVASGHHGMEKDCGASEIFNVACLEIGADSVQPVRSPALPIVWKGSQDYTRPYETHQPDAERLKTCKICQKKVKHLDIHMETHLPHAERFITCKICQKKVTDRALTKHMSMHLPGAERLITCKICQKKVKHLDDHMKRCHALRTVACRYPGCDMTFVSKGGRNKHERYLHENVGTCKQQGCGKRFNSQEALQRHMKLDHMDSVERAESKTRCPSCKRSYPQSEFSSHVCQLKPTRVLDVKLFDTAFAGHQRVDHNDSEDVESDTDFLAGDDEEDTPFEHYVRVSSASNCK